MADGAILFGRDVARDEVERLRREGYPFVSIGRIEADGPVAYVAADYVGATSEVMEHLRRTTTGASPTSAPPTGRCRTATASAATAWPTMRSGSRSTSAASCFHDPETLGGEQLDALLDGGSTAIVCENHRLAVAPCSGSPASAA
jgi:DNA-binding LacI/PurR family transcriptional regulator